jgi:hypothetical protein
MQGIALIRWILTQIKLNKHINFATIKVFLERRDYLWDRWVLDDAHFNFATINHMKLT